MHDTTSLPSHQSSENSTFSSQDQSHEDNPPCFCNRLRQIQQLNSHCSQKGSNDTDLSSCRDNESGKCLRDGCSYFDFEYEYEGEKKIFGVPAWDFSEAWSLLKAIGNGKPHSYHCGRKSVSLAGVPIASLLGDGETNGAGVAESEVVSEGSDRILLPNK